MKSQTSDFDPSFPLALTDDEVHVWRAELDLEPARRDRLWEVLSPNEQARALRFFRPRDREHFIAARGVLRWILARYLDRDPAHLQFSYGPSGKPALAAGLDFGLRFNLSHSGGLALYAVTRGREIGIDVERLQTDYPCEQIAERFFSPSEIAALRSLPPEMKCQGFFDCWTRKEAFVKARGEGLSLPLDRFDVSLAPGEPAALLRIDGDPQKAAGWSLEKLAPGDGYVAALAVSGHGWRLKCWEWECDE